MAIVLATCSVSVAKECTYVARDGYNVTIAGTEAAVAAPDGTGYKCTIVKSTIGKATRNTRCDVAPDIEIPTFFISGTLKGHSDDILILLNDAWYPAGCKN
jgi:hypothetical protein